MFSVSPSSKTRFQQPRAGAVDYLEKLPELCRDRGPGDIIGQYQDVIQRAAQGINPRARLDQDQQRFVEGQFRAAFKRYLMTRDIYGQANAAFHRDIQVAEIITAINTISPCSRWPILPTRRTKILDLFDRFKWDDLINDDDNFQGKAPDVLVRLSSAIPERAAVSAAQEAYLRRLVRGVILKFFEQAQDQAVGEEMAILRLDGWCLTVTSFCASCTGR